MLRHHKRARAGLLRQAVELPLPPPKTFPGGIEEGDVESPLRRGAAGAAHLPRLRPEARNDVDSEALPIAFDQAGHPL